MAAKPGQSRRDFLKNAGGLLIGFNLTDSSVPLHLFGKPAPPPDLVPSPGQLDSWLRVEKDGNVRVFTGKVEIGMGVETALIQIVAEELDVSPERVTFIMGDTGMTADQGGVGREREAESQEIIVGAGFQPAQGGS